MFKTTAAAFVLFAVASTQAQTWTPVTSLSLPVSGLNRETASYSGGPRNADGDVFWGAVYYGAAGNLFNYLDDFPDDFIYDVSMNPQDNGDHLITGAPTNLDIFETDLGGGQFEICVLASTAGGEPWLGPAAWAAGVDTLFFGIGDNFGVPPDGIDFLKPGFIVKDAVVIALVDGEVVAVDSTIFGTPPTGPLADIGGLIFDEELTNTVDAIGLCWLVNIPTPGAAALFGLAGLVAARRRRA